MYEAIAVGYPIGVVYNQNENTMQYLFEVGGKQKLVSINKLAIWSTIAQDGAIPSETYYVDLEQLASLDELVIIANNLNALFSKIASYSGVRQGNGNIQNDGQMCINLGPDSISVDNLQMAIWTELQSHRTMLEVYSVVNRVHDIDYSVFCTAIKYLISRELIYIV